MITIRDVLLTHTSAFCVTCLTHEQGSCTSVRSLQNLFFIMYTLHGKLLFRIQHKPIYSWTVPARVKFAAMVALVKAEQWDMNFINHPEPIWRKGRLQIKSKNNIKIKILHKKWAVKNSIVQSGITCAVMDFINVKMISIGVTIYIGVPALNYHTTLALCMMQKWQSFKQSFREELNKLQCFVKHWQQKVLQNPICLMKIQGFPRSECRTWKHMRTEVFIWRILEKYWKKNHTTFIF